MMIKEDNKQTRKPIAVATYELWFLGNFCEAGIKCRGTFNYLLREAVQMMKDASETGLDFGEAEICSVSADGKDVETVWCSPMDIYKKVNR
tara:strand:+ start:141 stop:413 length:273 start_codon:yes stop_codon:yes gene_type:complete